MSEDINVRLLLEARDNISKTLKNIKGQSDNTFSKVQKDINKTNKSTEVLKGSFTKLSGIIVGLGATIGAAFGFSKIIEATSDMQRYTAMLEISMGSTEAATAALEGLKLIASKTPFELNEINESFVKMRGRGIKPTMEQMLQMADLAASQGKSYLQYTEAILDAQSGENERLKEFGIKAKVAGDKVTYTFNNQTKTVKNNEKAISEFLMELGKMEGIAGSASKQMGTLGGMISNLKDKMFNLFAGTGNKMMGFFTSINNVINKIFDEWIPFFGGLIEGMSSVFGFVKDILNGILEPLTSMFGSGSDIRTGIVDFINYFIELYNNSILVRGIFNGMVLSIKLVIIQAKLLGSVLFNVFKSIGYALQGRFGEAGKALLNIGKNFKDSANETVEALKNAYEETVYRRIKPVEIKKKEDGQTAEEIKAAFNAQANNNDQKQKALAGAAGNASDTKLGVERTVKSLVINVNAPMMDNTTIESTNIPQDLERQLINMLRKMIVETASQTA